MKVEVLIYAYLAVCIAMIGFNIVCIFLFRRKEKRLERNSRRFLKTVGQAMEERTVTDKHRRYLSKKLKNINQLMAFDKALEEIFAQSPNETREYLRQLSPVFTYLTMAYRKKNELQAAYYPYLINKYKVFQHKPIGLVMDLLLELVQSPGLYVRENSLQAIYSIGSVDCTMKALGILNKHDCYHHPKMIMDGLLNFAGDTKQLGDRLWENLSGFSNRMQRVILDYFRFSSPDYGEKILELLNANHGDDEVAYSCIRYFGKYAYAPAYPVLMDI